MYKHLYKILFRISLDKELSKNIIIEIVFMWREKLHSAIKIIGSQQKLAIVLELSRAVVNHWLNHGIKIPLKHALHIEVLTNGYVKAEQLAPDAKKEICIYRKYLFEQFYNERNGNASHPDD
jgi:DNA-binding transcriptional regulator YdaS (Cro superfamily)